MKRFLSICLFVVLSILVTPSISTKYNAIAGRTVAGGAAGDECACGFDAPPVCYAEGSTQPCSTNNRPVQEPPNKKPKSTGVDAASLGLLLLTALYLFRRFI